MLDFQERMAVGKAARKRTIANRRIKCSRVRNFSGDVWRHDRGRLEQLAG